MSEKERTLRENSPYELAKRLETALSLIGIKSEDGELIAGGIAAITVVNKEYKSDDPVRFAAEIRTGVNELLEYSNVTNAYKLHIKELVESYLTDPGFRIHAAVWFGNPVMPVLEECGIDLQKQELGIFNSDKTKLKILERDIIRLRLDGWGSYRPEHKVKMQNWSEEFEKTYGEHPPVAGESNYENPVIRSIWLRPD